MITFDHFSFFIFLKKILFHKIYLCSAAFYSSKKANQQEASGVEMKRPAGILKNTLKKVSAQKAALKKVPTQKPALKKAAKGKVNTNNLKQLGEMSLKEKVQAIAEEHSDEEAGALALVETMTKAQKSNAWNQHMTSLRKDGNESLKKDFEQLSKNEKGKATALFLMQKHKPVFGSVSKSASKTNSLKKREREMDV